MSDLPRRAIRLARREGVAALVSTAARLVYDRGIRPHLPRRTVTYNGVAVPAARALDGIVPWHGREDRPDHEAALVRGIREHVREGDRVVVVGGGTGASSVVAARWAGPSGTVTTFEGAAEQAALAAETVRRNGVADRVRVEHAVVGDVRSLRGPAGDAPAVDPGSLPDCEVLVLDCEGAEIDVLRHLAVSPRAIVVETHGLYDAPPDLVADLVAEAGYAVRSREIGGRTESHCREHGIYVLVAVDEATA